MLVIVEIYRKEKKVIYIFKILAKSGELSNNILQQAEFLIERLSNERFCDWNNDWKLITIFVGVSLIMKFI